MIVSTAGSGMANPTTIAPISTQGSTTIKQEPGTLADSVVGASIHHSPPHKSAITAPFSHATTGSSNLYHNSMSTLCPPNLNQPSQPNTFVVSRINNPYSLPGPSSFRQPSSRSSTSTTAASEAIQAIKHPLPQQGLFQTSSNPDRSGFEESTFSTPHNLPNINSANMEKHYPVDLDDIAAEDYATESEESDADLDDFFPQSDPLSGLSFAPKLSSGEIPNSATATMAAHNIRQNPKLNYKSTSAHISSVSGNTPSNKKSSASKLEDVTGKYPDEEENYTCGICNQFDPPLQTDEVLKLPRYTTEWVGCDCERWFHKPCTKMKKFMKSFSCKSVKMKCLSKPQLSTNDEENVTYAH